MPPKTTVPPLSTKTHLVFTCFSINRRTKTRLLTTTVFVDVDIEDNGAIRCNLRCYIKAQYSLPEEYRSTAAQSDDGVGNFLTLFNVQATDPP